jgi:hypothetical protein
MKKVITLILITASLAKAEVYIESGHGTMDTKRSYVKNDETVVIEGAQGRSIYNSLPGTIIQNGSYNIKILKLGSDTVMECFEDVVYSSGKPVTPDEATCFVGFERLLPRGTKY